ncbi:MAG: hypothetical protein NTY02_00540 [Acidobacteria bacterium]|nr:hypothetical protein [Acidobacteriota bacterium]
MAPEFSIRSDSVDVEQIMKQIRARIRDKRGVDYTEDEIRELANVKLEKFLDPSRLRSDLLQHYRRNHEGGVIRTLVPPPENYAFDDFLVYGSARGGSGRLIGSIRKLLNPVLKLFINPNPIIHVLHRQSAINAHNEAQFERIEQVRADLSALNYEVIHNLVVEMTRLGIEVKNLKMRVESLSGRLDFNERRARSLETVVQYRPGTGPAAEQTRTAAPVATAADAARGDSAQAGGGTIKGEAQRARRRRRRRGRGSAGGPPQPGGAGEAGSSPRGGELASEPADDAGGPEPAAAGADDSSLPFDNDRGTADASGVHDPGDSTDQ